MMSCPRVVGRRLELFLLLCEGNMVYHSAATLHAMANPLMAFLAMFLPCRGQRTIWILSALGESRLMLRLFIFAILGIPL